MDSILDSPDAVQGIVYVITHASGRKYVGQTLSHRLNRSRYRPFGAEGRFRDHISEAICNTKRKQCTYLNNAIRLYGSDTFTVAVLEICSKAELDNREVFHISEQKSLYPHGFNLTPGGRFVVSEKIEASNSELQSPRARGGCSFRSPETRAKMSLRSKEALASLEVRTKRMEQTQAQHAAVRAVRFAGKTVDHSALESYLHKRKGGFLVRVDSTEARFIGKYESEEALKKKALEFLASLPATLPNCSGNP